MYSLEIKPEVDKIFNKLLKKNPQQLKIISKKILEIQSNPNHDYKFLRKPLNSFNRVHIDKHFVLIFRLNHNEKSVEIFYFDNHDRIYKWLPSN